MLGWFLACAYNVRRVDASTCRAAQIYGGHVRTLARHLRLGTMLNLRGSNPEASWYRNMRAIAAAEGVDFIDLSLSSKRLPERTVLLDLLAALDRARAPVLMTCSGGADRTSLASALAVLHRTGDLALARRQMRLVPYLHWPKPNQRWIRAFLDFFEADAKGRRLADWLATAYAPERFAAFMRARGQDGYWLE
jgi:protein tyrosine/serine phosphatase